MIEEFFGWAKTMLVPRRGRRVGYWEITQQLEITPAAFNLIRMCKRTSDALKSDSRPANRRSPGVSRPGPEYLSRLQSGSSRASGRPPVSPLPPSGSAGRQHSPRW